MHIRAFGLLEEHVVIQFFSTPRQASDCHMFRYSWAAKSMTCPQLYHTWARHRYLGPARTAQVHLRPSGEATLQLSFLLTTLSNRNVCMIPEQSCCTNHIIVVSITLSSVQNVHIPWGGLLRMLSLLYQASGRRRFTERLRASKRRIL